MSRYSVNNSRPQWKSKSASHSVMSIQSVEFSRLEYWSLSLLHGIFPTQRSNPDLPHCRRILYQLSHQGSPVCGKNVFQQYKVKVKSLSHVQLFATPWTVVYHTPLSVGFSRQGYWSGLPFPSPEDLPDPGIEPRSPVL